MKYCFLVLLSCMFYTSSAQKLDFGPEEKGKRRDIIQDIIHHDETGFYALRSSLRLNVAAVPLIEKYNKKMEQEYSVRLDEFESADVNSQGFFSFENRLFIAGSKKDRSKKRIEYFFREINKSTGKMTGEVRKIATETVEKKSSLGNLSYRVSQDSTKMAVLLNDFSIGIFGNAKEEKYEKFTLKVFNNQLEEQWSRKVKLPYKTSEISVLRFDIDNKGDIYLLTRKRDKDWKQKKAKKVPFYSYKILAYRQGGEEIDKYDLSLGNKFFSDITFELDKEDNLICSGFYSEKFTGSIAGTFFFSLDAVTKEIKKSDTKEFSTGVLSLFMKEKKAKKGKELRSSFDLEDFILRSDGGAVLVGEDFRIITSTYMTNGQWQTTTTYYHGPLIIVNINPEGQIDWVQKVAKDQRAGTPEFSSYALAVVEDKLQFIFNRFSGRGNICQAVAVDSSGKVSEKELYGIGDSKMRIRVPGCEQISKDEMIIYTELRKKFRFGKVKF